jgi:hypothetical protein
VAGQDPKAQDSDILASYENFFHKIEARKNKLVLSKKIPPLSRSIPYEEIAMVEHKRVVDYSRLTGIFVAVVLLFLINFIQAIKDIFAQLVLEIELATGSTTSTVIDASIRANTEQFILLFSLLLYAVVAYYSTKFILSLGHRLIVYRSGKNPISTPMPLTGDGMMVLKKINEKTKEHSGVSKEEVQKIIGEQIRDLLSERMQMQENLVASLKKEIKLAKTPEDKKRVKQLVQAGIDKLNSQDEIIDRELKKTGMNKEELFKKYRIKLPKDEFIDSVLKSEGLENIMDENSAQ